MRLCNRHCKVSMPKFSGPKIIYLLSPGLLYFVFTKPPNVAIYSNLMNAKHLRASGTQLKHSNCQYVQTDRPTENNFLA